MMVSRGSAATHTMRSPMWAFSPPSNGAVVASRLSVDGKRGEPPPTPPPSPCRPSVRRISFMEGSEGSEASSSATASALTTPPPPPPLPRCLRLYVRCSESAAAFSLASVALTTDKRAAIW